MNRLVRLGAAVLLSAVLVGSGKAYFAIHAALEAWFRWSGWSSFDADYLTALPAGLIVVVLILGSIAGLFGCLTYAPAGRIPTGRDFILRCRKCGTRTSSHVEANYPGEAEPLLRKEWRASRIEPGRAALSHQDQPS